MSEQKFAYFAQLQLFRNINLKHSIKYISRRQGGAYMPSPLIKFLLVDQFCKEQLAELPSILDI